MIDPPAQRAGASATDGVARGFLALGLGEAVSRLIAFAAMVYAARVLGAGLYGVIGFAVALVLFLNRVVDAGFELGLGVREIAADPTFAARGAPSVQALRLLLAVGAVGVLSVGGALVLPSPDRAVLAVQSLTLVAVGIGSRWVHLGFGRAGHAAVAATVGQLVMAGLVFAAVRSPADLLWVPAAQVVGDLVGATLLLIGLRSLGMTRLLGWNRSALTPLVPRSVHLVSSALLGITIFSGGLVVLRAVKGTEAAGFYTAAYTLVTFFLNVGGMYNLSLLPSLTKLAAEPSRQRALFADALVHMAAFSIPLAAGGALLSAPLVELLYGDGYQAASIAFGLLVWSIPLNVLRDVALMGLMAGGQERLVARVTLAGAITAVVLSLGLVPWLGLAGAGVATLGAEAVRLALAAWFARGQGFGAPSARRLFRPVVAAVVMAGVLWLAQPIAAPAAVLLGGVAYLGTLVALGGVAIASNRLILRL